MRARLLLAVAAALQGVACFQERLDVEISTRIHPDGSCERRIEYRLEHSDTDKSGARVRVPIDPGKDGLRRLHRFPSAEPWRVRDESGPESHVVVAEAFLPSPNDVGSDYSRTLSPRAPAASNSISYGCEKGEGAVCEYAELFFDPASPPAVIRGAARFLLAHDDDLAKSLAGALGSAAPSTKVLKRVYRERFAKPLADEAERLSRWVFFGPRERSEFEALLADTEERTKDLALAVSELAPAAGPDAAQEAVKESLDALFDRFTKETPGAEEALDFGSTKRGRVHFKFTLVMPGPILRANTCFSGDTATWEFDDEDLYVHGFDVRARAAASPPQ